jgi:hypothetical protein
MDALLLYYGLLALWIPLLWPALALRGWKRGALLVVVLAGALATANEAWQTLVAHSDIRIDIFLFVAVLGMLYAVAAAVLWVARWHLGAIALAALLLICGGGIGYRLMTTAQEAERLTETLEARDALLFHAMFRDKATYDNFFGPFGDTGGLYPAGHWQGPARGAFTRLVVNADGRAWLFYHCGATECAYAPGTRPLERIVGESGFEWRGLLRPVAGDLLAVQIVQQDDDHLTVVARGQSVGVSKAPPPVEAAPPPDTLAYLGAYAAAPCIRKHAAVRQLWLWREGDRLFAAGVFRTLVAGQRALFVTPSAMGEGRRQGDAWVFDWMQEGERWTAAVSPGTDAATLRLTPPRREAVTQTLSSGAIFGDETTALAPRRSAEAWKRWFATVWVGHFFSGEIPACP